MWNAPTHITHAEVRFFTTNRSCNADVKNSTCEAIAIKIVIIINHVICQMYRSNKGTLRHSKVVKLQEPRIYVFIAA